MRDTESNQALEVRAKCVVNATGVWVDALRQQDGEALGRVSKPIVAPSQGVHLVVDREFLPGNHALMVPKTADGRVLSATNIMTQVDADTFLWHSVERALAHGDVAVLITEPALTNIGIVLPEPGFLAGVRELCTQYGALLLIDETHTFSAGPGGCTAAWDLQPDIFVIGKSIGGGVPSGAYGITEALAEAVLRSDDADIVDVGGVGGTLAGNALSTAAMRATLGEVLTDDAFGPMIDLGGRFAEGTRRVIDSYGVNWSVSQLGARAEYRFAAPAPRTGTQAAAAGDAELEEFLHLYTSNRDVLITPFHNMALMSPATSAQDVDRHTELFDAAVAELVGR